MKTVRKRIEDLEKFTVGDGQLYFVRCEDGVYRVDDLVMNEKQYQTWLAQHDNDSVVVFEVKRGERENDKQTG
jgi:hypothetical protein